MRSNVIALRAAAPSTSHPVTRAITVRDKGTAMGRPKMTGALPQVIPLTATPVTGTIEGALEGAVVGAILGWAIGHFAGGKKGGGKAGAMWGAGLGAAAGGGVGYYEANNPTINVSPNGSYTVNVPQNGGNLNVNGPSTLTVQASSTGGGSVSNATVFANGANSGNLSTGSNTITAQWTDSSGTQQTATITANVQ